MNWIEVTILTTPNGIEPVSGRMYRLGIQGVEIVDDADDVRQFLQLHAQYWDYVDFDELRRNAGDTCVKVYVSDNESGLEQLQDIRNSIDEMKAMHADGSMGSLEIRLRTVREEDWANNWKQYFKPLPVGERILVKPSWETDVNPDGRIVLELDPGMVFGTGTHETTQLCMEQLERYVQPGMTVLDLGCGSGILSIVGLLLGAKHAMGVDIDPNAQNIAYENAAMNAIGQDRYTVLTGDVLMDEDLCKRLGSGYDVVVANIVADVIIPLTPQVERFLKPGGVYITSGIIEPRSGDVQAAMAQCGMQVIDVKHKGDWYSIVARIKGCAT